MQAGWLEEHGQAEGGGPERALKSRKAGRTLKHIRLFFLVYLVFTILQRLMAKAGSKEANFRAFLNGGPAHRTSSLEVASCLSHGKISENLKALREVSMPWPEEG